MRRPGLAVLTVAVVGTVGLALAAGGCKKPAPAAPPPVPIAALGAIPADATAVVGLDIGRLARSRLVGRAIDQMFDRDPDLHGRLTALAKACGIDFATQVKSVHLAIGPAVATGPRASLLVATGQLAEATLTRCLQAGVGSGGGEVTMEQVGERTVYRLATAGREYFFGFGHDDTVVLGPREDWVVAGLGGGPKVETSPVLGPGLAAIDRTAAMWAVATVDPELGTALSRLSKGAIAAGPTLVSGTLDPVDGVRAAAMFTMKTAGDARALADYAKGQLALGTIAAQLEGLGKVLAKVTVDAAGTTVRFRVDLTDADVKDVLAAIDRGPEAGQDAQPPADAGTGAPAAGTTAPASTPPSGAAPTTTTTTTPTTMTPSGAAPTTPPTPTTPSGAAPTTTTPTTTTSTTTTPTTTTPTTTTPTTPSGAAPTTTPTTPTPTTTPPTTTPPTTPSGAAPTTTTTPTTTTSAPTTPPPTTPSAPAAGDAGAGGR
ncbi:MAG TPA: hypothetical protein VHE35_08590 [Kofleriaceae bacterium]|nr:hypothetical protein [Kofleriaceae bacterium]